MDTEKKIKMALAYAGITVSELARRIGQSPQNLNQKIKRDSLTHKEMEQIAAAIGMTWRAEFVLEDGTTI